MRAGGGVALLRRLCTDPAAVQALFPAPLPEEPVAARVVYFRQHFTTPDERRESGAWWTRELVGSTEPLVCATLPRLGS